MNKWIPEICIQCENLAKEWIELHPDRPGKVLCLECHEKSKEYIVYLDFDLKDKQEVITL